MTWKVDDGSLLHRSRYRLANVTPVEVLEVLRGPSLHGPGRDGTRVVEGQTAGRYLRVVCRENESDGSILVITAYDLVGKARSAFRRRRRR